MFNRKLLLGGETIQLLDTIETFLREKCFENFNAPEMMVFSGDDKITSEMETGTNVFWADAGYDDIRWSIYSYAPMNEREDSIFVWVGVQTEEYFCGNLYVKMKPGDEPVYVENLAEWDEMARTILGEIDFVDLCMDMMD